MSGDRAAQAFRRVRSAALAGGGRGRAAGLHYIFVAALVVIGAGQAPTPAETILVNGHIVTGSVSAAVGPLSLRYAQHDQRRRPRGGSEDQPP